MVDAFTLIVVLISFGCGCWLGDMIGKRELFRMEFRLACATLVMISAYKYVEHLQGTNEEAKNNYDKFMRRELGERYDIAIRTLHDSMARFVRLYHNNTEE